tara:strand:+ start:835 stop:1926 length:1092 start_codon:yes stop_codon:yes gene_type:complete
MKWKSEEIALAIKKREEGKTWGTIAFEMYAEGHPKRSESNYSSTIARLSKKYDLKVKKPEPSPKPQKKVVWTEDPATRRQCKYVASLSLPEGTREERETLLDELMVAARNGQFTKKLAGDMIAMLSKEKPKKAVQEDRRRGNNFATSSRWTPEEDAILIEWKKEKKGWPMIENRTQKAVTSRWNRVLRHNQAQEYIANNDMGHLLEVEKHLLADEPLQGTREHYENEHKKQNKPITLNFGTSSYPNTQKPWAEEESLDVLVYFHHLNIDEARERYGRPYWVIAKHVEKHFDFVYSNSEDLIMRATEITNSVMNEVSDSLREKKPSRSERRKARKAAKKQAKIDKKIAKAEKKLNKLKGDEDGI